MPRGEKVGDAYVRITSDGSAMDEGIRDGLRDADPEVKKAGERHAGTYGKSFERGLARRRVGLALAKNLNRASNDPAFKGAAENLGKQISKLISKGQDDKWIKRTVRDMHRLSDSTDEVGRSMGRHAAAFIRFRGRMDDLDDGLGRFARTAGRLTGRGSRNNFIHFFGGLVGGITGALRLIPRLANGIGSVVRVFGSMRSAFTAAGGGFSGLAAAGATGGKAFASFAASGAALAAALLVLLAIIGPLTALFSGLIAAATALAGSLTLAAAAAGGALLGALMPLAAGAGVVAAAFIGMDKAQKKLLSNSFAPLTREFSGLGDVARRVLVKDIASSAKGLAPVIHGLRPLVRGVAEAMGDVFKGFSRGLQGSKFEAFKRDMQGFLPNAVRSLGSTFGHVFGGLGGLFRALIPLTNRFLNWINRITGDFSDWINTSAGQTKMIGFFQRAGDAAKSVGGFLKQAARALGTLLGMGAKSGNNIFDSMANSLARFTAYLNNNPGAVQKWFANGVSVAKSVGNAIMAVVQVFRALDNQASRTVLKGLFTAFIIEAKFAADAIKMVQMALVPVIRTIGLFITGVGHAMNAVDKLSLFSNPFGGMGDDLLKTGRAMRDFSVATGGAGDSAKRAKGGFDGFKASTAGLKDSLNQVTGAATSTTRELIRQKLISTGLAASTKSYGVSMRDLIGAATGNAAAQRTVNAALKDGDPATRALRSKLAALGVEFNKAGKIVRQKAADLTTWGQALKGIKDRNVRVAIRETGMEPTIGKFKELIRTQHLTPRQIRIAAKALNVGLTSKQLRGLIKDSKNLDKQKPRVKPTVHDKPASRAFTGLVNDSKRFGKQKPQARPSVNHKPATTTWKQLMKNSREFDRQRPKPTASVNPRPAISGLNGVIRKVNETDRKRANPRVTIHTAGEGALRAALGLVNSFRSRSITVTTHYDSTGRPTNRPSASGGMFDQGHKLALGGIVNSRTFTRNGYEIGESGREAVVPMNRPLAMVDPSVRWLSALAQGKAMEGLAAGGKTVNMGGVTVITPTKDPGAVATELLNQLVTKGY